MNYPYAPETVAWKRPPIDREIIKACMQPSDIKGLLHCLGTLGILTLSGGAAYVAYLHDQWGWMVVALYVHGGLFAFNPQTHELSHGTMFKTKWMNAFFKRVFGLVHWTSNAALYRLSHGYHHRFTLHRKSEGEEVHPRPEHVETLLQRAVVVINPLALITSIYDRIFSLCVPFERNPRRGVWHRYVYTQADNATRRDVRITEVSQFLAHVAFAAVATATGHWFLVVVVSLPAFYGGKWYHTLIHDTMHVGREPETDTFQACCRSVKLDPFSSFLYWHMEWHVEHHAYPGIPCYNLKTFHEQTQEHWDKPQTLVQAWREMNVHSEKLMYIPPKAA